MAGYTPFQFSSKMLQEKTTSGILGGISLSGSIADAMQSAFSWYEMWINPEKVDIKTNFIQKPQHTAGSIVTYHYRQENPKMSVSGQCGWVMIESESDSNSAYYYQREDNRVPPILDRSAPNWMRRMYVEKNKHKELTGRQLREKGVSDNTDNSPRKFLSRLKGIADEPMYFVDVDGVEHYNTKLIKIFTKQFPDGVICEGYYTSFDIPESSDDVQTISYNFEFTIERIMPITLFEQSLSMFGLGDAKKQSIGRTLRKGF